MLNFEVYAWLGSVFLLAVAVGAVFLALPKMGITGPWARFLFGFSLTPFIIPVLVLVISFFAPSAGPHVFLLTILAISATFLALSSLRLNIVQWPPASLVVNFVGAIALGGMLIDAGALKGIIQRPVVGGDATQYLREALEFAKHRDIFQLNSILGSADGQIKGDIHSPIWAIFLSYGLMIFHGLEGAARDFAVGMMFFVINIFLLTAILSISQIINRKTFISIAAIIFISVISWPEYSYSIGYHSRDIFRLLAIVLLLIPLVSWLEPSIRGVRPNAVRISVAIFVAAAAGSSHTLALVAVLGLVAAWAVAAVFSGARPAVIASVVGAFAIGTLIGAHSLIVTYLHTGSLLGDNFFPRTILEGTAYRTVIDAYNAGRLDGACGFGCLAKTTLMHGGAIVPIAASVLSIAVLLLLVFPRIRRAAYDRFGASNFHRMAFLALATVALFPPFMALADAIGVNLSFLIAANLRYNMQWYIVCVVTLAFGLDLLVRQQRDTWRRGSLMLAASAPYVIALVFFLIGARQQITGQWNQVGSTTIDAMREVRRNLPSGDCRFATEVEQAAYYLAERAVNLYSRPLKPVFMAADPNGVVSELKQRGICAIVAHENFYIAKMDGSLPLKALLLDRSRVEEWGAGYLKVYVLK